MKTSRPLWKSIRLGLFVLAALVIYAYGFQETEVSFEEIREPRRQESLTRVLRALARPDLFEYEQQEFIIETPFYVPCPAGGLTAPEPDKSGPYLVINPPCAEPRSQIEIEGFNFEPETQGPITFIPPSQVSLRLGDVRTDADGHFKLSARVPARPNEQVQYIRTITRRPVGAPHLTQTAKDTWDKIVETVFLALLATTFGVALAIPVSFLAARNIMRDVTSPMAGVALSVLGWPLGIYLGAALSSWIGRTVAPVTENTLLSFLGVLVAGAVIFALFRWALPPEETRKPGPGLRLARLAALLVAGLMFILALFLLSSLALMGGRALGVRLGSFGFLGSFVANLGEILNVLITTLAALTGGALVSSFLNRIGKPLVQKASPSVRLGMNLFLGGLAGAVLFALLGAGIDWIYQIGDRVETLWAPAVVGAVLGMVAAFVTRKQDVLPVGLVVYYVVRTLLNALRAIEALIMAIVFVVWVGIGPFAGVLALSLHTIAALAKLYSEQVESIAPGPLEAVRATGATRLQTIIYAVIPQIVPPYISFTMYRWDINVRMSTIIGFAGGGGIGFLLIQNINLLNYRAASAQMLAIAIVVAIMDFLSSYMREKVV